MKRHVKNFGNFLFENNTEILQQIKNDFSRFLGRPDSVDIQGSTVVAEFRDLGNWVHDEENSYDREEDDENWREDDDQMIWAPGEYKKYAAKFEEWAKDKPWRNQVNISLDTSEKSWCYFTVKLK